MKNNRKIITTSIIGVVSLCIITLSLTYAYWQINKNQTGENVVNTACLEVTLEEEHDDILLEKTYPLEDSEGKSLTPYRFTVRNKCNDNASYAINLESMEQNSEGVSIAESNRLLPKYIKVDLNENGNSIITKLLEKTDITDPLLPNAYESHQLLSGNLKPLDVKNYELRLWLSYDADLDATNKKYVSKINVISTYLDSKNIPTASLELTLCKNTITASTTSSDNISTYEYNIDNKGWNKGNDIESFANQSLGSHTIKARVKNSKGIYSDEVEEQITINPPETIEIYGKEIPIATCENGLYKVEHDDIRYADNSWVTPEYRYAGVSYVDDSIDYVHNYVEFNNELWRIIGLVNVKTDFTVEQRLKIVRTDGIEGQNDFYTATSIGQPPFIFGESNDWTTSSLKNMLNGIYYESQNGECSADYADTCDFSNGPVKGLDDTAKSMIDSDVIWSINEVDESFDIEHLNFGTTHRWYEYERAETSSEKPYEWTKENDETYHNGVGLINPSDYGYATSGGTIGRDCIDSPIYNWYHNGETECIDNDWLKPIDKEDEYYEIWTMIPSSEDIIFTIFSDGEVYKQNNYYNCAVWPVVYLNEGVTITDGDGSFTNPFKLSVEN